MKKKMNLGELTVESFITDSQRRDIVGGGDTGTNTGSGTVGHNTVVTGFSCMGTCGEECQTWATGPVKCPEAK